MEPIKLHYHVDGDNFSHAGEASAAVKKTLRKLGIAPATIRRVAIALYEGEINMVIHANGGTISVEVHENCIEMALRDEGKGIADISLAMKEGYSTASDEVQALGFGAGMGLPNMKKNTDHFAITSTVNVGTTVFMTVLI
ncbi:MAG: ATP-binding protein [Eubacteriales bacterium]